MRICVIGKSGQIASALAEEAQNVEIIRLGRPDFDLASSSFSGQAIINFAPQILINAAAYTAVDRAEYEQERATAINNRAAARLSSIAASIEIPIIHLSTDYVFDGLKVTPYCEADVPSPINFYGRSKLAGERAVRDANPRHIILRTAWVYSHTGRNFVRTMLDRAVQDDFRVVSDQFGNPTYATDVARAILAISKRVTSEPYNKALYGVFHSTAGSDTSWAGFAEAIFAARARRGGARVRVRPIATSEYPTTARRPANSRLDCSHLCNIYALTLPAWPDGLERCMNAICGEPNGK